MAQNDTHVALIILLTEMWGGGLLVEKTFSGQNLCSCAFGSNIRSYTKQYGRMGQFIASAPTNQRPFGCGTLCTVSQRWHTLHVLCRLFVEGHCT